MNLRSSLLLLAPLLFVDMLTAQGRIVVAHDEWTLSSNAFSASAAATTQFARNVANWFTGGQPGNFRVWSNDFGLNGSQLSQAMTSAGHSWTVSTLGTFDLATLQQYDGVFVGIYVSGVNAGVLTQYVQGGGCVYLCAGSGGATTAATTWNPFLSTFGLSYASSYNGLGALRPIASSHPLFLGVSELLDNNGNSIALSGPPNPDTQILVSSGGAGLYAVRDGRPEAPVSYCSAKTNSLGCVPTISALGVPSVSNSSPFDVTATNVLNQKQGLLFYGYAATSAPFQGGTLCVQPPSRRTPIQASGGAGSPVNDCSGTYSLDFNAWIQSGSDPMCVPGQAIFAQYWSRDPASPSTTGLTNAISFVIGS